MKNWKYVGEVTKQNRPTDSLLRANILFDQVRPTVPQSKDTETELRKLVEQRIKEKEFDNFIPKKKKEIIFEDKEDNINEEVEEMTKEEMVELFWKIDEELNGLSSFGISCVGGIEKVNEKKIFDDKKVVKKSNKKKEEEKLVKKLKKNKNVKVI